MLILCFINVRISSIPIFMAYIGATKCLKVAATDMRRKWSRRLVQRKFWLDMTRSLLVRLILSKKVQYLLWSWTFTFQKLCVICFIESPLKVIKDAFYFILKALFVLKIFKFLTWLFVHVEKMAWLERSG